MERRGTELVCLWAVYICMGSRSILVIGECPVHNFQTWTFGICPPKSSPAATIHCLIMQVIQQIKWDGNAGDLSLDLAVGPGSMANVRKGHVGLRLDGQQVTLAA